MSSDYWKSYRPSESLPWNRERVMHMHRRAGFSATNAECSRGLAAGYEATISECLRQVIPENETSQSGLIRQAIDRNSVRTLEAGWIMRMWHAGNPLTEQLCLMWHNHFATSFLKVNDCDAMWTQNQLFRSLGRGQFADLLKAVLVDRAMLIWLDADFNRASRPNENLARELMELFTLGEGNYTEQDVREAARALTGWRVDNSGVHFNRFEHDGGLKTILEATAAHDLDSLSDVLLAHPATAQRLAWRISDHFLGTPVPQTAIDQLAEVLREGDLHIGKAVAQVVRSERFWSNEEVGQRIRPPVSLVVGGVRELELHADTSAESAVSPQLAASWMETMGQHLFHPPGVAGWQGGKSWLGTQSMIQRAAFAKALSEGKLTNRKQEHPHAIQFAHAQSQLD